MPEKFIHVCQRCGHYWQTKRQYPKYCAGCKSALWNSQRKYQTSRQPIWRGCQMKVEKEVTAKRREATGRKAARLAKLEQMRQEFESEPMRRCVNCNATDREKKVTFFPSHGCCLCAKCEFELFQQELFNLADYI